MRGTRIAQPVSSVGVGIIPAHAGNTSAVQYSIRGDRDHPRACGEHWGACASIARRPGSSPRMRGTPDEELFYARRDGIIPAHAGNTGAPPTRTGGTRDHPRACGEHRVPGAVQDSQQGSSPRMRGTHWCGRVALGGEGIIPAHAGNTSFGCNCTTSPGDHPRACGEHMMRYGTLTLSMGSSPRMRGTLSALDWASAAAWDHPRACGEHQLPAIFHSQRQGSSPRMRGTRVRREWIGGQYGIIPAHAGNTASMAKYGLPVRDHPRACGEHICSGL